MDVDPPIFYNHRTKRWERNDSEREFYIQSILDIHEDINKRIPQLKSHSVNQKTCTRIPETELRDLDIGPLKEILIFYKTEQKILVELQKKHDSYYESLKRNIQKMWNFAKEKMSDKKYSALVHTV